MVIKIALLFFILVSLLIESSIFPFPFVLLLSLLFVIFFDDIWALFLILCASIFLDVLSFHPVGITAVFIMSTAILIVFFEKIFSLQGLLPSVVAVWGSIVLYTFMVGYSFSWMLIILLTAILAVMVILEKRRYKKGGLSA
ncbi:MAG: hypothetical protein KA035_02855 [Candidatus Levybacteria bacterium]|nr:hypothetical protein [Candidatus Levybacteria bacterium]